MARKRPKYKKPAEGAGKKVTVWIRPENLKMWRMLDNRGAFVNMALEDAVGIMTWAILRVRDPERYHKKDKPLDEIVPQFNAVFPADPLTQARRNKQKGIDPSQTNSQPNPVLS